MFESLLNSILEKTLGQYIEGLKKEDLEVSVWSGDVELNNVKIKKDIFQTFGLPLELIYGQIGRLKICVPWKNIGSKPVNVEIENVIIVVRPITDQSMWKSSHTNDADAYNKKRDLINKFAHKLYTDLMKTKEELAKEAGVLNSMITKILDNLQVALRNIHLRIENEDANDQDATFSIAITLQSVDLYTTDVNLKKTYVDRSLPQNADLPIHKLLNLKNFGIYYKIRETLFVQHQEKDADKLKVMQNISSRTEPSGKFTDYTDAYLLDPIQLEVKLNQFDPKQALEKLESLITLNIKLESVGICLQKSQYDNLQQLLELTNSFMRFLNTAGLRQTKIYWQQMQETLQRRDIVVIKKNVKDLYQKIFTTQIAILSKVGVDEKKSAQLLKELNADLERQKLTLEYERVLLAIDYYELETWAKEVCTKKSEFDCNERAIQARAQGKGFLSSIFGSSKKSEEIKKEEEKKEVVTPITPKAETPKAAMFLSKFQAQMSTSVQLGLNEIETARDRIKNAIPKMKVNFYLDKFRVSLIDKDGFGIQWYSNGFKVELKMYDGSNKYNSKTMEVQVINQAFGVVSIGRGKQDIPFIQQLSAVTDQPACDIILKLGNVNHHESDLPKEAIDETDLELKVKVLPIEIIYQATPIGRLSKFFKVKHLDERTKLQAEDQFNQLQSQVNSISKSIEADFRNNKINIEVDAPCLVLPFKQETLEEVTSSECWVYQMGDFSFKDTTRADIDSGYHECFELKVQRVRFEYSDHYDKWKNHHLETVKILSEFSTSTLLVRKRDMDEMRTLENKKFLRQLRSPTFEIIAGFDTDLQLSLKPNIFLKLTEIGSLLAAAEQPEEYWIKKKQKRLESSSFRSEVKKQNNYYQWDKGMACLVSPRWLYFFDDAQVTNHYYFDLNGCSVQDGCVLEGQEITLKNRSNEICKLQCPSVKIAEKWHEKLIKAANDVDTLKKNYDEKQTSLQTDFDNPDADLDEEQLETVVAKFEDTTQTEDDESEVESFDQIQFGLKFAAPSLQLHLITEKVNRQASVRQLSEQIVYWELATRVEQLSVNFEQYKFHMEIQAKVTSLRVSDNCGDSRFPVIFENQAVEHQNELLTLKVSKIQKESPHYFDCDTEVSIGIGGLKIFWKPSSLILLFRFLKVKNFEKPMRENLATAMQDKVKSQMLKFIEKDIGHEISSESHLSTILEHGREDWKNQATLAPLKKQGTISDKGVQKLIKNCQQKPESQIKVDLQLAFLSFVCIHPQNTSYPIFSVDLKNLGLEYTKKCDCDQIKLTVTNLQIIDSTNYPKTLNPELDYQASEPLVQKEILGVNSVDSKKPQMLDLQITIFTYPETGSCPLQISKDFNMNVSVNLKQLKVIFMNEQLMRMIDYINHQIVLVIWPDNLDAEKVQDEHLSVKKSLQNAKNYLLWSKFDLKQTSQGPGLDIKIESPFVIIPDLRSDGTQQFDLDFGKITIVSKIQQEQGFWIFLPEKELFTSSYLIKSNNIRFDFNQLGQRKKIFNNEKLDINFKMPNYSPFFNEDEPVYTGIPQAPVFDLCQINSSQNIGISLGLMKMDLPQHVMNKIFDILNNNFFMNDKYQVHFEQTLRSKADKAPEKLKKLESKQESKQDRKLMQLSITASVLSLDFRDDQNGLISDICIVGFKYEMETYLSGRQSISLSAGSFFIFFDEYIESNLKEMLMGHINTPQFVVTDKTFYQDLPVTLLQTGKHKFKFTMDKASNSDSDIYLEMLQLKLWLRPQVFIDLSCYLVQALGRLSIETTLVEQAVVTKKAASSAVMKMKIHLDESLIIIQNDKISDKCIVLQTAMDLLMISKDPESIKQSGEKITSSNFYSMTIAIKNVAGYLCDLEELSEVSFKEAKKREFIQPSSCKIDMNSSLVTNINFGLYTENLTEIVMNEADLKISIDDLQVLNSILNVLMAEIWVLSAVWTDYSNPPVKEVKPKLLEIKEEKSDFQKKLLDKMEKKLVQNVNKLLEIKEDKPKTPNLSTMRVYLQQAKILIINESKDFYVPLFMLRCEQIVYEFSPINYKDDQSKAKVSTEIHLSYYNSDAGFFEPAIDRFGVDIDMDYIVKSSKTKINLADPININFTIGFADCVTQFNKIYAIAQDKATSYQQKAEDLKKGISMISPKLTFQRSIGKSTTLQKAQTPMGRERKLTVKQELEKLSSPFAVRNMTDKPIKILQVDRAGKAIMNQQEPTVVLPDEVAKLVLTKGAISLDGSQSENFIRIEFTGEGMIPLKRINLNQNNYFTKHSVFGKLEKSREFYVITSKMEDSRKVLTVRTQHVLTNQTKISYHIKIFYVEKDKIIDIKVTILEPGQSTPLQDFGSATQHQNVKISIRPKKHKKWGAEYKFVPMKEKMIPDENTEWPHLPTYTIIRKIKTPLDGVFDYALLPPMILKNCLPCPIKLQIEEEFKDKIEVKPSDAQGVKPNSQIVVLDKENEKHIYDIKNRMFTKILLLKLDLGNQFATALLPISPLQSKDVTFPIKITDSKNRSFNLFFKVETRDAGLKLILYCENMLICHTEQRLSFFYQKKPGVFDQDNSHELPSPIVGSAESDSLVYIFDDNQTMFCSLAGNRTSGFSDKLQIKTIGHVGDFSVTSTDSTRQYNFGYSVHLWLSGKFFCLISVAKNVDIPMTKIVEIAPQFIILNKTEMKLMYKQEQEAYTTHRELAPGKRTCYNWEDKGKPQLFTFKPADAEFTFCASFNLKDCGTTHTCSVSQGRKTYYRISKRQIDQSIFVVIEQSEAPYLIVNKLQEIDLRICQNKITGNDFYENVTAQQQSPFAWQDVNAANKLLEVEFRSQNQIMIPEVDSKQKKNKKQTKKISIDGINQTTKIDLNHPVTKARITIIVSVYKGAQSKVIEFSYQASKQIIDADAKREVNTIEEEGKEQAEEDLDDFVIVSREQKQIRPKIEGRDKTQIHVDLNQLTVSLIMNSHEYMNIVLRTLRLQKINTESDLIIYCTLDRIQIDNCYEQDPIFPVVIRPKCVAGDLEHDHITMQNVDHVFGFYAHKKLNVPNVTFFSTIEFLLRELEIKIEFDYIMKLITYIKVVQQKMSVGFYNQHQIFKPNEKQEEFVDYYEHNMAQKANQEQLLTSNWREKTIEAQDEQVTYIQRYVGSSMCFEITLFKQTGTQEQNEDKEKGSIGLSMAASGLKLTNLNGAPIKLEALQINDVYGHNTEIQYQFQAHYLSNMKYNILRVAGSSDLIGNPYNFVNNLGSGMKKYYQDPREQIMKGPQQAVMAGISLVSGSAGMAAHTAASASGYLGRITGSLNRVIVAGSFDREYIHKKEVRDIKEKPKSTLDGLGKGALGLGTSVLSGVTGLVTQPYQGSKQGAMGLVKGVGMGIAGLFTKPASGVVDLVSKTTQGIESGVTGTAECKQSNERLRKPRAFYLALNIVKEYNELDSVVYSHLRQKISKKSAFWACYICGDSVKQGQTERSKTNEIMLLTSDFLYSLSSEMKILWQCPVSSILEISLDAKQGLIIRGKEDKKGNRFQFPEAGTQLVECVQIMDDMKYASSIEDLAWVLH